MIPAHTLASICAEAYGPHPTWQVGDVAALSIGFPGVTAIMFRGTEPDNLEDWMRDFDAVPIEVPRLGIVHRGFWDGAQALLPRMPLDGPLVVGGHSMGGALAILTVAHMVASGRWLPSDVQLVTFGAPRVGGEGVRAALARVIVTEYRHGNDPVPLVPPYFEHTSTPVQIGESALDPIADHFIAGYVTALTPAPP